MGLKGFKIYSKTKERKKSIDNKNNKKRGRFISFL
jgi:hypothetical protein